MRIRPVNLPAPPLPLSTPSLLTSPDRLSLANSISPSAPFQQDDVEKLLTIPTFPYYLPKIPIITVMLVNPKGTTNSEEHEKVMKKGFDRHSAPAYLIALKSLGILNNIK